MPSTIASDIDKEEYERESALSPECIRLLSGACKDRGSIFGEQIGTLDARDFRHTPITDAAANSADLGAIAYFAGHKNLETTARYVHSRREALRRAQRARFGVRVEAD